MIVIIALSIVLGFFIGASAALFYIIRRSADVGRESRKMTKSIIDDLLKDLEAHEHESE